MPCILNIKTAEGDRIPVGLFRSSKDKVFNSLIGLVAKINESVLLPSDFEKSVVIMPKKKEQKNVPNTEQ